MKDILDYSGISSEAGMASLYIKDPDTAERVAKIARQLGTTKTEALRRALSALEKELSPEARTSILLARLDAHRKAHPLPPPTGRKADKAFFDEMWGEEPD